MEYWLKGVVTDLQHQWAVHKGKVPDTTRDAFVASLDPAIRSYMVFLVKTVMSHDCLGMLKHLAKHLTILQTDFPGLISPMAAVLIQLGTKDPSDPSGLDTSKLSAPSRNHLTAGALYRRYEQERVNGLFAKLKSLTEMPDAQRLEEVDALLLNPSLAQPHVAVLNIVRTCLSSVLPVPDLLKYVLDQVESRGMVIGEWLPRHPLAWTRFLAGPRLICFPCDCLWGR